MSFAATTLGDVHAVPELITARLLLRGWRLGDGAALEAINADPDVTRYLGNRKAPPDLIARIERYWAEHGFGIWALEALQPPLAGRLIGFVGLGHPTFMPQLATRTEIAWRLARETWGQGLATEAAVATRDHAFGELGLEELIAVIHPDNVRSRSVAVKLGMALEQRAPSDALGFDVEVWQLPAPSGA